MSEEEVEETKKSTKATGLGVVALGIFSCAYTIGYPLYQRQFLLLQSL